MHNALLFVCSKTAPFLAEPLYKEAMRKCLRPTDVTLRALFKGIEPENAASYLLSMEKFYGLKPKRFRCEAVVGALTRSDKLGEKVKAMKIVLEVPRVADEVFINTILSRFCLPDEEIPFPQGNLFGFGEDETKEEDEIDVLLKTLEAKRVKNELNIVKDFVGKLHEKGCAYGVRNATYSRIENCGLTWPSSVSKKMDKMIEGAGKGKRDGERESDKEKE